MIEISTSSTTTTLTVAGDLDLAERDQFPEIAARVVGLRRQLVVIDMCRVTFMDSTGADPRDLFVIEICGALDLFRIDTDHRCESGVEQSDFRRPDGASAPA